MASLSTKCPYCRRRYQQAAAYEKHLETMHHDILLSLRAIVDTTLPGLRAFAPNENSNQCDSDYESDPMLEIADCYAASNDPGDMQHDSDEEDFSQPPDRGRPSSQESIPGAGRALGDVAGYTELNEAMIDDPWNPFYSEADFNLVSWLVRSKVSKSQIDAYFAEGLGGMDARSFRSAYTLQQHLDVLDPFGEYLTWTEAAIGDGRHTTTFYYRNALDCVRYLVRQVAYRSDMVYAPIREYDSSGERLYSEMHTADWWWDTQV